MSDKGIIVFVTAPSHSDAADIAKTIVSEKLAACVNIIPGIRSIFFWDNKVQDEQETLMIIKTTHKMFEALRKRIIMTHPYSVPEIISVEIQNGNPEYMQWIFDTVSSK